MKIGIMGASFDPPHVAHLAIAEAAYNYLGLDEVLFVPALDAPLKANPHEASFEDRMKMLEIALEGFPHPYRVLDIEKRRGGPSYSVDTAKQISNDNPEAELFLIIGTDQLAQLDRWRDIEYLSCLVKFACFDRNGYPFKIPKYLPGSVDIIHVPFDEIDVSSSNLREAIKNHQMRLDLIDGKVLNYIKENKLYTHV